MTKEDILHHFQDINFYYNDSRMYDDLSRMLDELISENKGDWIVDERPESNREIICSNCEQPIFKYHKLDFDYRPNFCPNCGADMRGVSE